MYVVFNAVGRGFYPFFVGSGEGLKLFFFKGGRW